MVAKVDHAALEIDTIPREDAHGARARSGSDKRNDEQAAVREPDKLDVIRIDLPAILDIYGVADGDALRQGRSLGKGQSE